LRFASLCVCALAASCSNPFNPPITGVGESRPIAPQISPDSTLANFHYSYEYRDIDTYDNCLDEEFVFVDPNTTDGIDARYDKYGPHGDLARTAGLFAAFDEIRLDPWGIVVQPDTVWENGETMAVRNVTFRLSVRDLDGNFGYAAYEASGYAVFIVRRSSQDQQWRVFRWIDRSATG
jgi:hypothetical protein